MIKKKTKSRKKSTPSKKLKKIKNKISVDEELIIKVTKHWSKKAYANKNSYQKKYNHSIKRNEDFWRKEGKRLTTYRLSNKADYQ